MNNRLFLSILTTIMLITLASCEDYVDVEIPGQQKKIVAFCFISPQDTMLRAVVYQSVPLFDSILSYDQNTSITNAMVKLSDGINTVQIPFNDFESKYVISANAFPITAGTTYTLTVEVAGLQTVTAETTVPVQTPHFSYTNLVQTTSVNQGSGELTPAYNFEVKWNDYPNEANFYGLNVFHQYTYIGGGIGESSAYPVYNNYINDNGIDGNEISHSASADSWFSTPEQDSLFQNAFVFYLLNCSEDYYRYHRSVANGAGGSDPFSEPTIVYTNINNGLGCFGSFNGSVVAIEY